MALSSSATASVEQAIRTILRKTALLHYSRQSEEKRAEVRESFYRLDESQDGKISLAEFLESTDARIKNGSGAVISKIFSYVDEDKSGFLEFDEYLVFTFIMEAGFQLCDACLAPVIIAGYTCKTCWADSRLHASSLHDAYDLCATCYASDGAFSHPPDHQLVPTSLMYHHLLHNTQDSTKENNHARGLPLSDVNSFKDSTEENNNASRELPPSNVNSFKVQCDICNEYHTKDLESLFVKGNSHVVTVDGSSSRRFVCDWCASYVCRHCGLFFSDAAYSDVKPLCQWLRTDLWCGRCNKYGSTLYEPIVSLVIEKLKNTNIPQNCPTCAQKLKDGTLARATPLRSSRFMDPISETMANNLLLQQSYFSAKMMADFGKSISKLAGGGSSYYNDGRF